MKLYASLLDMQSQDMYLFHACMHACMHMEFCLFCLPLSLSPPISVPLSPRICLLADVALHLKRWRNVRRQQWRGLHAEQTPVCQGFLKHKTKCSLSVSVSLCLSLSLSPLLEGPGFGKGQLDDCCRMQRRTSTCGDSR